ncbi:MAG: hypothetical protein JNK67_16895 [Alphaproteobacteria bacterium]|nr:hypothetical protein [Alphaproteobacteria bacterium]
MFGKGCTSPVRRTPRRTPQRTAPLASGIAASLGAVLALAAPGPAIALTITGTYIGGSFSAVPYFTCGPDWNCADPAARSTPVTPTDAWVTRTFDAAAAYWARRIDDPWTVDVTYGFADLGDNVSGAMMGGTLVDGRYSAARIQFNSRVSDWFISPTPGANAEFQPLTVARATLPTGAARPTTVTTGLTTAAIPYGPDSIPSVTCGGVPCGAHQDLLGLAIHELAHALNINSAMLRPLQTGPSTVFAVDGFVEQIGRMRIPNGPLAGTTLPWTSGGGGHPFLKPAPGLDPIIAPPAGLSADWLDTPNGELVSNAYFFYGAHRKLVSDLDAVLVASVSDFRRVNLDTVHYVALPEFTGATTPRPEAGATATLLTVNGVATLTPRTDAGGATVQALRLTPDAPSSAGSAFLTKPFGMSSETSFRSSFSFRLDGTNGDGALGSDGFAFVVHRDPRGAAALANGGGDLGYGRSDATSGSLAAIARSLAIEFDTHRNAFDPDGNHIAFLLDGDVTRHLAVYAPGFSLNDGLEHFVWIEYDAATDFLSLFLSDSDVRPDAPVLRQIVDLSSLWGPEAYFGFTAATGGGFNTHDILSWNLEVDAVPANGTLILLASALTALGITRRAAPAPWTGLRRPG